MNDATNMFYPRGHIRSKKNQKVFNSESLLYNTVEDLMVIMEKKGVPKVKIAKLARVSRRKLTISKLSKICFDLGVDVKIIFNDEYQLI